MKRPRTENGMIANMAMPTDFNCRFTDWSSPGQGSQYLYFNFTASYLYSIIS